MRKNILRVLALTAAVLFVGVFLAACGDDIVNGNDNDPGRGNPITIGVMLPLSGDLSNYGRDMLNAYELAVAEINERGGVLGRPLELFPADDRGDPMEAVSAANRIIAQGVDFVVGGYASGATIPTLQLYYDAGLLFLISASNSTVITEQGFNQSFMVNSPGTHQIDKLIELLETLDVSSVALIHQGCAFSENLSNLAEGMLPPAGFEIAAVEVMVEGAPDVSAIVTSIRNSGADFVYWCAYHADGGNMIRQLRRGGFEGYIAVGDGSASEQLIAAAAPEGEGVFVTSAPFAGFVEGGAEFMAAYYAMHGVAPNTSFSTLAYDTIYLLAQAIEEAGTIEMQAVRDAVQAIDFNGLTGNIRFTEDREPLLSNFMILQIVDDEFVLVTLGADEAMTENDEAPDEDAYINDENDAYEDNDGGEDNDESEG